MPGDPFADQVPADRDEEMEAFAISPMALSFEAAGIIGMCSTIIIGNGLLCVLSFRKPNQSYTGNITLLYVAVADIFTAIITMPLMVASLLELKWKYGDLLCKTTGVLTMLFLSSSLLILCVVLLHRFWLVFCSSEDLESLSRKQVLIFLVVVVLAIAIACLVFLIDWRKFQTNPARLLCRLANSPNYIAYRMYYCALHGATPTSLTELISPYVPRRALRSADQLLLQQPTHKLKLIGLRAFSVCAPYLWNSLPFEIKSSASVSIFKAKLKTYLFRQAYF
ncbi:unnamed protein product [Porites lobata]|uniref:G-protein coupled receptors family 1 profile domain-containing protein n=1 Tax=Porites lobata TaxID=104759 RepID=A0ABN8NQZ0_9CNID|nr:unnamed protein product [Porites lobata]